MSALPATQQRGVKIPEIDLNDPGAFLRGVPHHWFRRLRREAPVYWQEEEGGPGFWVVTRYHDLRQVSLNQVIFSSAQGTNIRDVGPESLPMIQSIMLNMDPPQHVKYRRLVQKGFTPRRVKMLESRIRDLCTQIIDRVAGRGECEFVGDLAAELPLQVICEMVGVPLEDRHLIYDLSNRLIGFDDPDFQTTEEDGKVAAAEMYAYAQGLFEKREANPGDDVVSRLVDAEVDGARLTPHEFNSFFLLLMVAGNETTRTAASHGMHLLVRHPEQRQRLLDDPSLIPSAVEEIVRFEPPVMYFRRTATRDTELRDVEIRAGEKVTIWYTSANRDEDVFPHPDTFDITRSPNEHLGFGIGEHYCLGANLARLELKVIFEELLRRLPDIELTDEPRMLRSNFINAIKYMPVKFSPGA
jgi:cytochrome P450